MMRAGCNSLQEEGAEPEKILFTNVCSNKTLLPFREEGLGMRVICIGLVIILNRFCTIEILPPLKGEGDFRIIFYAKNITKSFWVEEREGR